MIKYNGGLKNFTFPALRKQYPAVQKRVYETLLAITPEQLQFELNAIPDKEHHKFCSDGIDTDTLQIISTVMSFVMNEDKLILTRDDVTLAYFRFCELIFLYEATRQGVMVVQTTDTDIDYYFNAENPADGTSKKQRKLYRGHVRRYTGRVNYD
jgi:hypothetical protein